MATKVHMEALSPTMEEGELVRWLKGEGDEVANGDILAEIETDKAVMELVARGDGILRRVFLAEGGTAEVGAVIGVIGGADEDVSDVVGVNGGGVAGVADEADESSDSAPSAEEPTARPTEPDPPPAPSGRIKASPLAKRMAGELGIELAGVAGTGPQGRVVKRDIEAAKTAGIQAAPSPTLGPLPPLPAPDGPEFEDVPVSQLRKTIARRLVESIGPVPTYYLTVTVDMSRVTEARHWVNAMLAKSGVKTSVNDFVLKAAADSLARHPECNAHWRGDTIRRYNRVHLGVAVAIDDGLITPVVRDAHAKGIDRISAEVRELAGRARTKRLSPEEYTGSTFSVSNLGMFGIHEFTAIINPPEAGILAVGGIEDTPVVRDGEVLVRPLMRVTMSCDHRVIDGAQGARLLATLKTLLEEPEGLLV